MKVLILLALCAFTTAMVARDKRALNEEEAKSVTVATSTKKSKPGANICLPTTPCAWSIYKPVIRTIQSVIQNTYCICSNDTECLINEEDKSSSAYVHFCLPPGSGLDIEAR